MVIWVSETILKIIQVSCLKIISNEFNGLRKSFRIKIMIFPPHFASGTVYRLLWYVFKVAMHAKRKRFQITRDICKFYLHLHRSTMFSILVWTIQSEISYIIYSLFYAFLFFVVRFVVIFDRLTKTIQFLRKIHGNYFRSYYSISISSGRHTQRM